MTQDNDRALIDIMNDALAEALFRENGIFRKNRDFKAAVRAMLLSVYPTQRMLDAAELVIDAGDSTDPRVVFMTMLNAEIYR